jgi:serine/threonine-protein kinase
MADDSRQAVDREQRLDDLLVEYLEAAEAGTAPERGEILRRHPDLADELAAFFADQDQFDSLVAPLRTSGSAPGSGPTVPDGPPPGVPFTVRAFGDYELLEEVARGGMGVVYKARQVSLNRTVALKMILKGEFASPEEVQRFRMEAEAAANLDHPNIVPIYEVGEHQGQPYFSMKFVEGGNVGQHVGRLLDRQQEAARLLVAVARAVHYAHQRGILHRDLKPANILLSFSGRSESGAAGLMPLIEGVPHVTDFGLAKRVGGRSTAPPLTHSGAAVGTPSYMAPEQASGRKDALTTAADVYSLGAILYECLTGRPPFQADTPLDTLMEVVHREPIAPRLLRPPVHRDLETICLKCLQKEPGKRYAGAAALADDLRRYLAGEPILARPVGRLERLGRWCLRNPALTAAAAALAVAVLVSCAFALSAARSAADLRTALAEAERHAREAQRRAEEAQRERARAEESFRQAHQAVNACLRVSNDLDPVPGVQPLRKRLLAATLQYYQEFLQERGDDPALKAELAATYFGIGEISSATGSQTKALDAYGRALALYQELARAHPDDPRYQADMAHALGNMGLMQAAISRPAAARESTRQALALVERLVGDHPSDRGLLRDLAGSYEQLGARDRDSGDFGQALEHFRQGRTLYEQLLCVNPRSAAAQEDLALCVNNTGVLYGKLDRLEEALRWFEAAGGIRAKLAAEERGNAAHELALAASYRDQGLTHQRLGRRDEALRLFERAKDLRARMARENPSLTLYQSDLAASLNDLGNVHLANQQLKEALARYNEALGIQLRLARIDPNVTHLKNDLARTHYACGRVLGANRQYQDALRAYGRARTLQENLVRADPGDHEYQHDLAETIQEVGQTLAQLKRPEEGLAALGQATEHERAALKLAPQVPKYRRSLGDLDAALAEAARRLGRPEVAAAALLDRRQLWPEDPHELYRAAAGLALTAAAVGNDGPEQAQRRRYADLAVETLRQAVAHGYRDQARLRGDPSLAALRGRADFQELLARLQREGARDPGR